MGTLREPLPLTAHNFTHWLKHPWQKVCVPVWYIIFVHFISSIQQKLHLVAIDNDYLYHMYTCIYMHIHICISHMWYTYINKYMYTYTYTYIHIYTHIHKYIFPSLCLCWLEQLCRCLAIYWDGTTERNEIQELLNCISWPMKYWLFLVFQVRGKEIGYLELFLILIFYF